MGFGGAGALHDEDKKQMGCTFPRSASEAAEEAHDQTLTALVSRGHSLHYIADWITKYSGQNSQIIPYEYHLPPPVTTCDLEGRRWLPSSRLSTLRLTQQFLERNIEFRHSRSINRFRATSYRPRSRLRDCRFPSRLICSLPYPALQRPRTRLGVRDQPSQSRSPRLLLCTEHSFIIRRHHMSHNSSLLSNGALARHPPSSPENRRVLARDLGSWRV